MNLISYKGISIRQGENVVLHDVQLNIGEGEMVYLIGNVGSGKSSLMKSLYGQLPVEGESAEILGMNLLRMKTSKLPALRRQLGIVFQDFQLLPDRTVRQNLDFVLRATGWKRKEERDKRIVEVLEMVKLPTKVDMRTYELSGGEQQRVCIARALLNTPKIILADEPTGNLDNENGELVLALLDEIRRTMNTTIIVSTHNLQWIEYFPGTVLKCQDHQLIIDNNSL